MQKKKEPDFGFCDEFKTKAQCQALRMTLGDLAERLGVDQSILSRQLHARGRARPGFADAIERVLGVARGALR